MTNSQRYNKDGLLNDGIDSNNTIRAEAAVSLSGSTLDWYKLTETSRHILSEVVSGSIQQQLEELQKAKPNLNRIHELEQISLKVSKLSRDAKIFKSKERMMKIIEDYSNYAF